MTPTRRGTNYRQSSCPEAVALSIVLTIPGVDTACQAVGQHQAPAHQRVGDSANRLGGAAAGVLGGAPSYAVERN